MRQDVERAVDDAALVGEREARARLLGIEPTRVLDLVVVVGGVAALVLEEEEVDELVMTDGRPGFVPGEPELDLFETGTDAADEPGLLGDLARGRLLERLAVLGWR